MSGDAEERLPLPRSEGASTTHQREIVLPVSSDSGSSTAPLLAYSLPGEHHAPIVPAPPGRSWMRESHKQFAHRCLPLLMANQSGWLLLNPVAFRVRWDGGDGPQAIRIEYLDAKPAKPVVASLFGSGILTWYIGYLFRTPPGYNLVVSGPVNMPKDGIQALQGLVETDWAVATFTMNWKLTRADHAVTFDVGEPFCMIAPHRRNELEAFEPTIVPIELEPELAEQWREFDRRRLLMNGLRQLAYRRGGAAGVDQVPWERHYLEGTSPGGWKAPEHQRKVSLRPFKHVAEGKTEQHPPSAANEDMRPED